VTSEETLARIDAFIQELKEDGIDDIVFAAGNEEGFMAFKYAGDPRSVVYLATTLQLHIMFNSMEEMVMEAGSFGREDNC